MQGSSSWLIIPFLGYKGAFRDVLCLRYGWQPSSLPSSCVCGSPMTVEHAFSCSFGGFPLIRHNELQYVTDSAKTRHVRTW